jgi:prepilin-type N-terminal cleavage/methylation domain-containing protein
MPRQKGFSLVEVIIAMIILSITVAFTIPTYLAYTQHASAEATQNNLIAIYNAQKNHYLTTTSTYCVAACGSVAAINAALNLNINDSKFAYVCTAVSGFTCTATNNSNATFVLTVKNSPLILPGGTPPLNPSCTFPTDPSYCPS